jgi:hypothetical protein
MWRDLSATCARRGDDDRRESRMVGAVSRPITLSSILGRKETYTVGSHCTSELHFVYALFQIRIATCDRA